MSFIDLKRLFFIPFFCWILVDSVAQGTEVLFLSGTDCEHTVDWEFFCTDGNRSGEWTTIPVPSNWELEGFGKYNYGHAKDSVRGKEKGLYKYEFQVPENWEKKQVNIVFEGSMTDTEVKINGQLAGQLHQGSFYRFKYNISDLLRFGEGNLLEVMVSKHSANESVNKAERYADFWIFGGIFRPVYLEAKPNGHIDRAAIDAKADGEFTAEVFLTGVGEASLVEAQVFTLNGDRVGDRFLTAVPQKASKVQLNTKIRNINSWNPEDPSLYNVQFKLISNGKTLHEITQRFGFRTVELRKRDGIYVNGVKVKFKGVNHHVFWPTTGRASSKQKSINDVNLIKSMNMNAVRCSHYPPDTHFLDVCDSLGLFVLDELTGWHDAYDTEVGSQLVEEMVTRDVNHPSIVLWDNGNEGGHNFALDTLYGKYDIQNRTVIHPWQEFNGTATQHYRSYNYGAGTFWNGHLVTFPTEFLHGLYDGGHGAGLYDYWELMWNNPRAAGGFLWVFADEGVVRTDKNGIIDTYGAAAADGILGPFHEKEGSYFAIKEIWSPVRFPDIDLTESFDGKLAIENRYFYTNLNECSFSWKLKNMPLPHGYFSSQVEEAKGESSAPDVAPGHWGYLNLNLPENWFSYDVLYVTSKDKYGRELYTRSYPITLPKEAINELIFIKSFGRSIELTEADSLLIVNAGDIEYTLGKNDGMLKNVTNSVGDIPFANGPALCAGKVIHKSMEIKRDNDTVHLVYTFDERESRMKEFTWTFYPSGWAKLNIYYVPFEYDVDFDYMGVSFNYPEELVKKVKWLGDGPYRVWKNRMHGVELDVHEKEYNNTITGVPPLIYPEFKGYHSKLYWAEIQSKEHSFLVGTSSEDVFLRLYTPDNPEKVYNRVAPAFPAGDISFLQAIPPIGTKSNDPWNMGPSGKKNMFFDYGPYDDWRKRSKVMTLFFDFSGHKREN